MRHYDWIDFVAVPLILLCVATGGYLYGYSVAWNQVQYQEVYTERQCAELWWDWQQPEDEA